MWAASGVADIASKSANGYTKLPSGLIIQWGEIPVGGDQTVSFPTAFPHAVFSVNTTSTGAEWLTVWNLTLASFYAQKRMNTSGYAVGSYPGYFMAVGY